MKGFVMIDFKKDFCRCQIPAVCVGSSQIEKDLYYRFRSFGGELSILEDKLPAGVVPQLNEEMLLQVLLVPSIREVKIDSVVSLVSSRFDKNFKLTQKQYDDGAVFGVAGDVLAIGNGFFDVKNGAGIYRLQGSAQQVHFRKSVVVSGRLDFANIWNQRAQAYRNSLILCAEKVELTAIDK